MEKTQLALKLVLGELGLAPEIKTVKQRKTVQKGVYVAQLSGVDLGYRYNWYVMGPYSPGLTRDYFALRETLDAGDSGAGFELQDAVRLRLASVRDLLTAPEGVDLDQSDWLELVASVHYLLTHRRLGIDEAREALKKEKRHVAPFTDIAYQMLQDRGLVAAT